MKQTKKEIRQAYKSKYGYPLLRGTMQISYHGAHQASIQIFRGDKLVQDVSIRCANPCSGRLID